MYPALFSGRLFVRNWSAHEHVHFQEIHLLFVPVRFWRAITDSAYSLALLHIHRGPGLAKDNVLGENGPAARGEAEQGTGERHLQSTHEHRAMEPLQVPCPLPALGGPLESRSK